MQHDASSACPPSGVGRGGAQRQGMVVAVAVCVGVRGAGAGDGGCGACSAGRSGRTRQGIYGVSLQWPQSCGSCGRERFEMCLELSRDRGRTPVIFDFGAWVLACLAKVVVVSECSDSAIAKPWQSRDRHLETTVKL